MDSGIYRLTYKTGETYVGKSIHLNIRWKQHFDKLSKGKAAKEMQDAYYASDHEYPETEVLLYCHPDMLDYYEGYFINDLKPVLNTAIPTELTEHAKAILVEHANRGFAKYSIVDAIQVMENQVRQLDEFSELEEDYHEISEAWHSRAVRDNWANEEYRTAIDNYLELEAERDYLDEELKSLQFRVIEANWWQRLWRTW